MKRLITYASLAAVGTAAVQAQYLGGDAAPQKSWSVSAKLRGFFDDNYPTLPGKRTDNGPTKRGSWGMDISPSASVHWAKENFSVGLSYQYGLRWYEDRVVNETDQSHTADFYVRQSFTERFKLDVSDNFVIAQEPDLIDPIVRTSFLRTDGNNLRNTAGASVTGQITEKFSTRVGYSNTLYDYEQTGDGSRSALLDRMEHLGALDLRWQFHADTLGVLGYQFGYIDQTSQDKLFNPAGAVPPLTAAQIAAIPTSSIRDNRSHYLFLGADHTFNTALSAKVRVGAQYTEYIHTDKDNFVPYADGSVQWRYAKDCQLVFGVKHARNQTDVAILTLASGTTLDQESTTLYGAVTQKIGPKLSARVRGQMQSSTFNQGQADSQADNYFAVDAGLEYEINKFVFAETGYLYDRLDSDLANRGFSRNRFYLGLRATY